MLIVSIFLQYQLTSYMIMDLFTTLIYYIFITCLVYLPTALIKTMKYCGVKRHSVPDRQNTMKFITCCCLLT